MTNVLLSQEIVDYILEFVPRDRDMSSPTAQLLKNHVCLYSHSSARFRNFSDYFNSFAEFVFRMDPRLVRVWFDEDSD